MIQIPANTSLLSEILMVFIRNEVHTTGLNKGVVGLSGGVDSGLSAMLAAAALGPNNVLAILMAYKNSNPESK
jgi:NAD+ synthase